MISYLERNLSLLGMASPKMAEEVAKADDSGIEVFPARKRGFSLRVNQLQLCSRYDPITEAERIVEDQFEEDADIIFILGPGTWHIVEEVLKRAKPHQIVVVVEADRRVLKAVMKARDITELLMRVTLLVAPERESIIPILEHVVSQKRSPAEIEKVCIVSPPQVWRFYGPLYPEISKGIKDFFEAYTINVFTLWKFGASMLENFLGISTKLEEFCNAKAFRGAFSKVPAIVVSAGPSLSKNIFYLEMAKGKALIISVGTAVKALAQYNIKPDIVAFVDPQRAIKGQIDFEGSEEFLKDTFFIYPPIVNPEVVEVSAGKTILFSPGQPVGNFADKVLGVKLENLSGGGSVATYAFSFACVLDADPIILIGQDLCYRMGQQTHAYGTVYDRVLYSLPSGDAKEVTTIFGQRAYSPSNMNSYRVWFESVARFISRERALINATEGGTLKKWFKIEPLRSAIYRYARERVKTTEKLREVYEENKVTGVRRKALERIREYMRTTRGVLRFTEELVEEIERIERGLSPREDFSKRAERWRRRLKRLGPMFEVLIGLAGPYYLKKARGWKEINEENAGKVISEIGEVLKLGFSEFERIAKRAGVV